MLDCSLSGSPPSSIGCRPTTLCLSFFHSSTSLLIALSFRFCSKRPCSSQSTQVTTGHGIHPYPPRTLPTHSLSLTLSRETHVGDRPRIRASTMRDDAGQKRKTNCKSIQHSCDHVVNLSHLEYSIHRIHVSFMSPLCIPLVFALCS